MQPLRKMIWTNFEEGLKIKNLQKVKNKWFLWVKGKNINI